MAVGDISSEAATRFAYIADYLHTVAFAEADTILRDFAHAFTIFSDSSSEPVEELREVLEREIADFWSLPLDEDARIALFLDLGGCIARPDFMRKVLPPQNG